jgi:Second Messenger Oligonucleotide or Dinucleotide Synthetase domain
MTLTTAQAFSVFIKLISPTDAQQAEIQPKRRKTEEYLREAFPSRSTMPLKRVILIGSADRGTLIRPVDDVDVMAEFTNKDNIFETYRRNSGAFLQRIRTALNAKTSINKIGARGQAVRLFYTSGAHVDIASVFKWSGSGYALPSGDGGWITTDPEAQAEWFAKRMANVGSSLTTVVKLAKRWNDVHGERLHSYHLEVMVSSMFSSVGTNWRDAMKCFFEWAPGWLDVTDPAGHSGSLSQHISFADRRPLHNRFGEALARAKRALAQEASGNHSEAKRLWRIELGEEFTLI